MKTALVTGSSGLIGSEMVSFLDARGWTVHGVDNNMRRDFFGEHGDTTWNLERLRASDAPLHAPRRRHPRPRRDRALVAESSPT